MWRRSKKAQKGILAACFDVDPRVSRHVDFLNGDHFFEARSFNSSHGVGVIDSPYLRLYDQKKDTKEGAYQARMPTTSLWGVKSERFALKAASR